MNLGTKIRELRKKKGLTQEQLANALGLSPQAVSKWEIEASYPDMTLIPVLANFFDVSLDVLFDFDITKKQQKIDEILDEAGRYFWGNLEKAEEIYKKGLEDYPDSDRIKERLLSLYECHMRSFGRMDLAENAAAIAGRLIGESADVFAVCSAKDTLASVYLMQGRYAEAKDIIGSLPYMYPYQLNDRMRCTSYHLRGEDRLAEVKGWKIIEWQELFIACDLEGQGYWETGDYERALASFREAADVVERFMIGDNICYDAYPIGGSQTNHMCMYLEMAGCLLKLGRGEECGRMIDRAYDIISHAWDDEFEKQYDDIMMQYRKTYKEFGLDEYRECP